MPRYFLEVAYKGTRYSGFQVQPGTLTIQSEVEKALRVIFPSISSSSGYLLTGSSRTDAGVHALQNFFHFDTDIIIPPERVYNLNAILPPDIVIKGIYPVAPGAHSRFDAVSRQYKYFICQSKSPFLNDRSWYYPFRLNIESLNKAAAVLMQYQDFTSFSKRNTQVKTFLCNIHVSEWVAENNCLVYHVQGNRFLRGMVRGLVGTMLKVGRGVLSVEDFCRIIEARDCTRADFSAVSHGLFLVAVNYPYPLQA
ncbi:tRNA pseudouridine(38-40) synthase TruA [Foetidibacter luteolus]|uniref:tRNA pseudouridine(38-40) synthase TruA n=1 Tax=Foetidibacter luteolus TaxID=2608880 RepID=UPI00129A4053|nr:tRNA pseudouridine(38-40) synthase TruA [Foetidibacter luteolus]